MHARRLSLLVLATCLCVGLLPACSGGGSGGDPGGATTTTTEALGPASPAFVKAANAACLAGKQRTSAIAAGPLVVPAPSTPEQEQATRDWAEATASSFDQTATDLATIDASGADARVRARAVAGYRAAADDLRARGGAVLGEKNFLSDQQLSAAGLTDCFAPVKPDAPTTSTTR